MNAIIPLNISALRASCNDNSNVLPDSSAGRIIQFNETPWNGVTPSNTYEWEGSVIHRSLRSGPVDTLEAGIHLHWELPDFFRRGQQDKDGTAVVFPHAPNRWLVVRHLRLWDPSTQKYGAVHTKAWVVESDYIGNDPSAIPVPLPTDPGVGDDPSNRPYHFMGRVLDFKEWTPSKAGDTNYLPDYPDGNKSSHYLTSMGFVGPHFASYYPECATVFGFWDSFSDLVQVENVNVFNAISKNETGIKFKTSYQVIGWINEQDKDPFRLNDFIGQVTTEFNKRKKESQDANAPFHQNPVDIFLELARQKFRWDFQKADIPNPEEIKSMEMPDHCLCSGIIQEITWDMLNDPAQSSFLENPNPIQSRMPGLWQGEVKVAVGNTTTEALAALIKEEMAPVNASEDIVDNVEFLLDALQSGWLNRLEQNNGLFQLDELLHTQSFSRRSGGNLWVVKQKKVELSPGSKPKDFIRAEDEITLPKDLAHLLHQLNQAQKDYDRQRSLLEERVHQVFMDWVGYLKVVNCPDNYSDDISDAVMGLVMEEIKDTVNSQKTVGYLPLVLSADGTSAQLTAPATKNSAADGVWEKYQALQAVLTHSDLEVHPVPAPVFYEPNDLVVVMEGDRIEPAVRNGNELDLPCRLSNELISRIQINFGGKDFLVESNGLSGLSFSTLPAALSKDVQQLIEEAFLLVPMLADKIKEKGKISDPNPEVVIADLQKAQGGWSPGEGQQTNGLFEAVRTKGKTANQLANPLQQVGGNTFTFTNELGKGWLPDPVGWSVQQMMPEFDKDRKDPFLPLFLVWKVAFDPLQWKKDPGKYEYTEDNLKAFFSLDHESIDYRHNTLQPGMDFTIHSPVEFSGSIHLSRNIAKGLIHQIDNYTENYPNDPAKGSLKKVKEDLISRKILAQRLSGFNHQLIQLERTMKVPLRNLLSDPDDDQGTRYLTKMVSNEPSDSWYNLNFNNTLPTEPGEGNSSPPFCPLRAGLLTITSLQIIDVFGQRMELCSPQQNTLDPSKTRIAASMKPPKGDTVHAGKIFLSPRLDMPARLWFKWLSASHDNPAGVTDQDCVEMNAHPSTSPVCGWVIPNHLDNSLFFYDSGGEAIGSFGIEHDQLVYRTHPGNTAHGSLNVGLKGDIGELDQPNPKVNLHLARFMWYINNQKQAVDFFNSLMGTIENAQQYTYPAQSRQHTDLAVLIGRPMALTRATLALESKGGVVPIKHQWENFVDDAKQSQTKYDPNERENRQSGNIKNVQFPVRLGDLAKLNDGLIGYLIDTNTGIQGQSFYSPAAKGNYVLAPASDSLQLQLNASPTMLTMLVDPRAAIHATTGILPVEQLSIPADQYARSLRKLAVTFFTHPVLRTAASLSIPHPQEDGYEWNWVGLAENGEPAVSPLNSQTKSDHAFFSYGPQGILEGWLSITEKTPSGTSGNS
ncbi:MAG: hypothetical protein H6563_11205 [Lewinellaceae bacterium]|nr:hypothetical protein [Lewinellaceae bacterium]